MNGVCFQIDEDKHFIIDSIFRIWKSKQPLHSACTSTLATLLTHVQQIGRAVQAATFENPIFCLQLSNDEFASLVWPKMENVVSVGWNDCSADALYLLLVASQHQSV